MPKNEFEFDTQGNLIVKENKSGTIHRNTVHEEYLPVLESLLNSRAKKEYRFTFQDGSSVIFMAKSEQEAKDKYQTYIQRYGIPDSAVTINESTRYNYF